MQRTLVRWFRHTPLAIPYFCMGWMVPFYMLRNHQGYLATYRYFRLRQGYGRLKSFWHVYLNHFRFGQVIIDRFAMYAGKRFEVNVRGMEHFDALDDRDEGFMIVSSHIGNYELAGYSLTPKRKTFHVLVYAGETEQVMQGRQAMFEGRRIHMIPTAGDMSHIYAINEALSQGDIVSIPGDRVFGSPRHLVVSFMGGKAHLPLGPYKMATQRDLRVLAVFVMKQTMSRYDVRVQELRVPADTPRAQRPQALADRFAQAMEAILREYPDQWFNYYDFWKE